MRNEFAIPEDLTFPNILSEGGQEFNVSEEEKANGPKAFGKMVFLTLVAVDSILAHSEKQMTA